nr:hypothetical protein [Tanacetum cinerariifolium]
DQFDAHPNPQPRNMNGWVDDDDDDVEEEEEDEENEDANMPFAVRNFPMGFYEAGESFTARDPHFVGGLAPWALRRDLEALRRHERIREAE